MQRKETANGEMNGYWDVSARPGYHYEELDYDDSIGKVLVIW